MLVLTLFPRERNGGNHAANAFFDRDPRTPRSSRGKPAIVADQPQRLIGAILAFSPMQQMARLAQFIRNCFTYVANSRWARRADIVSLARLHTDRVSGGSKCFRDIVLVQQIANLLAWSEVHRFIAPKLCDQIWDQAVRSFVWPEDAKQTQGDKRDIQTRCQRRAEKNRRRFGAPVERSWAQWMTLGNRHIFAFRKTVLRAASRVDEATQRPARSGFEQTSEQIYVAFN